ncbi:hypothetical protein AVEN_39268-1 [Araneus ventricosus]|uniref:Uncharacterized protein n=1 Tax=Araneus ventricosus TaxID=182803 RepID=A0A4Y2WTC5_ARAVE|nr:hypothetical protein AVEN_39268-1 [Araneus ventricosus]
MSFHKSVTVMSSLSWVGNMSQDVTSDCDFVSWLRAHSSFQHHMTIPVLVIRKNMLCHGPKPRDIVFLNLKHRCLGIPNDAPKTAAAFKKKNLSQLF